MKNFSSIQFLRASRGSFPATARCLAVAALLSAGLLSPAAAAPKNGGGGGGGTTDPQPTSDRRIAIGADTTPGDDDASPSLFRISQPGSYYLTANVVGVAGKSGIEIAAGNVTLDLNGFTLEGISGSRRGVDIQAEHVTVMGGQIRGWNTGISGSNYNRFAQLVLTLNSGDGLFAGNYSTLLDCTASQNGGPGIGVGDGSVLTRVISHQNTIGFRTQLATLRDCSAFANSGAGFDSERSSTFADCVAYDNLGDGFVGAGAFTGCIARSNARGFVASGTFESCSAILNDGNGFDVDFGSTVTNCAATANGRSGFRLGNGIRATGNTSHGHAGGSNAAGSGFYVAGTACILLENNCSDNQLGMVVFGGRNRIDGNNFSGNTDADLRVTGQYNVIVRNTARNAGGVNWEIAANNRAGAFVAMPLNGAINGATGGNGSGTTDPFANLSF